MEIVKTKQHTILAQIIPGDGNCLFSALALKYMGRTSHNKYIVNIQES